MTLKPYILQRFATWGHAWENASVGSGYQQTRPCRRRASGGLIGVGRGGLASPRGGGDTDLVFGMLCEEWGLIIAVLAVLCIITLAVFAVRLPGGEVQLLYHRCLRRGRTAGLPDLPERLRRGGYSAAHRRDLPLRLQRRVGHAGVLGLMAFLKATDTRQNASFAIRLPSRREERRQTKRHSARWKRRRRTMRKIEKRAAMCLLLAAAPCWGWCSSASAS